jgi:hypothetical protein
MTADDTRKEKDLRSDDLRLGNGQLTVYSVFQWLCIIRRILFKMSLRSSHDQSNFKLWYHESLVVETTRI